MTSKFLQLNIEEGKRWETIEAYVKQHGFDILHFQEVTGGRHNAQGWDSFSEIKERLGYEGIQGFSWKLQGEASTYFSNSTFFKPGMTVLSHHVEYLSPYKETTEETLHQYDKHTHCALDVVFELNGHPVHFINTHLPWGLTPEDKPYKVEQGRVLYEYVKKLTEPFVLSGDFNVTADSQTVRSLNELGRNYAVESGITNTLNPNIHRVQKLFPPGLAVDFLYTSRDLQTMNFQLVDSPDLSDHFGLSIELEV